MARESLGAYAIAQWSEYKIAAHHRKIIRALERVAKGECKRLMIFMPPRMGKSMLASEYFPAWYLGRNPDKYIICASYGQELATDWGRKVRNQLRDAMHQSIFPDCRISQDSQASDRLSTVQGGSYYAVGAGGSVTGRGAHLLLIDDPIKGREDADSASNRQKIKDWYRSVAYTRLMPGAAAVIINTRWHEDDLTGWLLAEEAKLPEDQREGWEVLSLPAITNGRALWPEAYPIDALDKIRRAIGEREWNALYMQSPAADAGDYFRREWFNWYDETPPNLVVYGASDFAVTDKGGDYSVHVIAGATPSGDLYMLDMWRGQTASDVWVKIMCDMMAQHKPVMWYGEAGVIRRSVEPFLAEAMRSRRIHTRIEWIASMNDKPARARAFQSLASSGRVFLPSKHAWGIDLLSQLTKFMVTRDGDDDEADACGLLARGAGDRLSASVKVAHKPPARKFNWRVGV